MKKETDSPWVNKPKQQRSRESLDRLINSAKEMLLNNTFEQSSVQMIVKKANSSIGSFYNFFKDKESLLRCLMDNYEEKILEKVIEFKKKNRIKKSMSERGLIWITLLTETLRKERGLLRSRIIYNIQNPNKITEYRKELNAKFMMAVKEFFLPSINDIQNSEKEKSLEFILMTIDYALVYRILLEEMRENMFADFNDGSLIREFHLMFVSYLGLEQIENKKKGK